MKDLNYLPAQTGQYEEFFKLMLDQEGEYLNQSLAHMHSSLEEFAALFRRVGQVYGIYEDGKVAGFYWIEERGDTLHLHALILQTEFQGHGVGSQILAMLANKYATTMERIELGVHKSNTGARRLYERVGYQTVKELEGLGYFIMQKELRSSRPT